MFNQSLVGVTLPRNLQQLHFGHDFNNPKGVALPSSLRRLSFDDNVWKVSHYRTLEEISFPHFTLQMPADR